MNKVFTFIKSIFIPLAVGGIVGFLISSHIDYNSLNQPPLSPPSIVFPIVWTILYILMGVSYGILKVRNLNDEDVNFIYYLQLIVNALWSIVFFLLKWRLFSFIWILILDFLVVVMIVKFYEKNKVAGLIQIPYLIWIIFASYLNLTIYFLNK